MTKQTSRGEQATLPSVVLPLSPASGRMAREFVRSLLHGVDDGRLDVVVTELVTNAVVHGHSRPELTVTLGLGEITVEVGDDSPVPPVLQAGGSVATSGRGLSIVDHLAEAWGVSGRPDGPGKVVWARLATDGA